MANITKFMVLFFSIGLFCLSVLPAKADVVGLSVNKSFIFLGSKNGKNNEFSFKVRNLSPQKQIVHLEEKDISIGSDNEIAFIPAWAGGPSSMVQFDKNDFPIEQNESIEVRGKIDLSGLKVGSAQMVTLVSFKSQQEKSIGSLVEGSIGIYMLLDDEEHVNFSGKILAIDSPIFIRKGGSLAVKYINNGDKYFIPRGLLGIKNIFTKKEWEVPFEKHFVFPGAFFTYKTSLSNISTLGVYRFEISFVDGNGNISEKSGYCVGKFFPLVLLVCLGGLFWAARLLMKINRKNSGKIY